MVAILNPTVARLPKPKVRTFGTFVDAAYALSPYLNSDGRMRWPGGVTWTEWTCPDTVQAEAIDCELHTRDIDPDGWANFNNAAAFTLWDAIQCSTLSADPGELEDRIRYSLDDLISYAIAQAFILGAGDQDGYIDNIDNTNQYDAESFRDAMGVAEQQLANRLHGALGFIHTTPRVIAHWTSGGMVTRDGDNFYSPLGHRVVADSGYNEELLGVEAIELDPGDSWVITSGPVYLELAPFRPVAEPNTFESLNLPHNDMKFLAERQALIVADACGASLVRIVGVVPVPS